MTTQLKERSPPVGGTYSILTQISYHHVVLEFAETLSYIPPPPLRCHAHLTSHVASSNQLVPHIKRTIVDMKEGLCFVRRHYIHSSFFLAQPLFAYALCLVPAMPPMHYQSISMSITRGSSLDDLCCYHVLWCQSSYIEQVYDSLT